MASAKLQIPGDEPVDRAEALLDRLFPSRRLHRVFLVNPPDADASLFRPDTARRGRYANYPPYGLLLIAANLRLAGIEVRVTNLNHEVLKRCREASDSDGFDFDGSWQHRLDSDIKSFGPDLIGVTCMFTMTHESFAKVCHHAALSGCPVAVGGVHVTNDLERVLAAAPDVRVAFTGEGDRAIRTFVEVVNQRRPCDELGQIVLIDAAESPGESSRLRFASDKRPRGEELDVRPAYDLIDLAEHSREGTVGSFYFLKPQGTRFGTLLSNRGCRAQCSFCSVRNFNGVGVRSRSVEAVVDELVHLREDHGIDHIMWLDDDLFYDRRRALRLFEEIARRNLGVTWDATNGVIAASCTEEMIDAAEASGCIALNIGMESGNPEILKSVRKPASVDVLLRAAEVLQNHERIHASVFLMLGFPNETLSMIWDTIRVAAQMDLDWYRISQLQPLPNTPIHDAMKAQGLIRSGSASETRYRLGSYGKQNEVESGIRLAAPDFLEAFSNIPLNAVPTPEQLGEIWFFMNYRLNFARIFREGRPTKLAQLRALLTNLSDIVAPEHPFALYFLAYLQHHEAGEADARLLARLRQRLEESPYWSSRLRAFGLSIEDLVDASPGVSLR